MTTEEQVLAGQAVYTRRTLAVYDLVVLGISNRLIWKCPTARLLQHYHRHLSASHLDVGAGTGFFLDRCQFPTGASAPSPPRVALLDLNQTALAYAARRISRYQPEVYCRNVLAPIEGTGDRFHSVAVNYLLHCLPGDIETKSVAFDTLRSCLVPGGVLFGSTILGQGVPAGWPARRLAKWYNQQGIFSNADDRLEALEGELRRRFEDVTVDVAGCVALFAGRTPAA